MSIEALQMQVNELDQKVEKIYELLLKKDRQRWDINAVASMLRVSYGTVYKRAITQSKLEPNKEIFFENGKWFVSDTGLQRLRETI